MNISSSQRAGEWILDLPEYPGILIAVSYTEWDRGWYTVIAGHFGEHTYIIGEQSGRSLLQALTRLDVEILYHLGRRKDDEYKF